MGKQESGKKRVSAQKGEIKKAPAKKKPVKKSVAAKTVKTTKKPKKVSCVFSSDKMADSSVKYHLLKISLQRTSIWRRVAVPSGLSLDDLHGVIQLAMGWEFGHLHEFELGNGIRTGDSGEDLFFTDVENVMDKQTKLEKRIKIRDALPEEKSNLLYTYDFGDGWEHLVAAEKIGYPVEPFDQAVVCVKGKLACPPEDCGGVYGYAEIRKALADPANVDPDLIEWLPTDFNPDLFDLDDVNLRLAKCFKRKKGKMK